jgi:hypothetical protein
MLMYTQLTKAALMSGLSKSSSNSDNFSIFCNGRLWEIFPIEEFDPRTTARRSQIDTDNFTTEAAINRLLSISAFISPTDGEYKQHIKLLFMLLKDYLLFNSAQHVQASWDICWVEEHASSAIRKVWSVIHSVKKHEVWTTNSLKFCMITTE